MGPSSAFLGSTVGDSGCHLTMAARRTSSGVCAGAGNDSTRYFRQSRRVVVVVLVYRARDSHLSRAVAVKVFSEHPSAGSGLPPALRGRRAGYLRQYHVDQVRGQAAGLRSCQAPGGLSRASVCTHRHAAIRVANRRLFQSELFSNTMRTLIFQQLVHQPHPRFPQPLDILGQTSMPQRRLLMT